MSRQTLIDRIRRSISENHLVTAGEEVLVGVSGGIDSVALLHMLVRLGVSCRVAHVNYGLRGHESDEDAAFVVHLCEYLNIPCTSAEPPIDWLTSEPGASLQERAREFRYRVFEDVADQTGIPKVAVGHHLDDQAETILLRLVRGTGLRGLAGMRSRRPISKGSMVELVRPLLSVTRADIMQWVSDSGIAYRDDRSNLDMRFDRARMRSTVVPAVVEMFGAAGLRNIVHSAAHAQAAYDAVVSDRIDADFEAAVDDSGPTALKINALQQHEPGWRALILLEAVRRWMPGTPERAVIAARLERLLSSQPGKQLQLGAWSIWRARHTIVFVPQAEKPLKDTALSPGDSVETGMGMLVVDKVREAVAVNGASTRDPNTEMVDDRILDAPLSVGAWRPGDRFQPIGMTGRKKVSDFLTDQKVTPHLKSTIPVVRSGGAIVWVVGYRLAHPFRVRPDSTGVIRLRLLPK